MWFRQKFPAFRQSEQRDCGPTCLKMIGAYYKADLSIEWIRQVSKTSRIGTTLRGLSTAAEKVGFKTIGIKTDFESIAQENIFPCIAHWQGIHFVVIYKIKNDKVFIADPAIGLITYSIRDFLRGWIGDNATTETQDGNILILDPTPVLFDKKNRHKTEDSKNDRKKRLHSHLQYVLIYKRYIWQIIFGFIAGSIIQVTIPFITQSVIDVGIQNQNINFIYLVLGSQALIQLVMIGISYVRSWILLHMNTRINISVTSDFFIKLMKLPMSYFDVRMTGDIMQRITDLRRIERLLSIQTIGLIFSLFNFVIFGVVLAYYNLTILTIFLVGSTIYFLWVLSFLKRRKAIDHRRFAISAKNNSKVMEMVNAIQEIKLNSAEQKRRWEWEKIQVSRFRVSMDSLKLTQTQGLGSTFINQIKNIAISLISASLVIEGQITLGMMFSISYIIGQLNAPIGQFVSFINMLQDARISLDRVNEVYGLEEEEKEDMHYTTSFDLNGDINIQNITFSYTGKQKVLENLNLLIPANKTTAIVGASGSGKTTLLKLLLQFYETENGNIKVGHQELSGISPNTWRQHCGVVMQESYLFNDSILGNITVSDEDVDYERLWTALGLANLANYVRHLPAQLNTRIGHEGINMSTGQKQRLIIARVIYKNPKFIFLDEATSALDASNENSIVKNLEVFFRNKTVMVIAHRLSTVIQADQIVVLDDGKIIEVGNHEELLRKKGSYYALVKNQLALDTGYE